MTFIALLCAFSPSLEAFACASEGCDPACLVQSAATAIADDSAPSSDNCLQSGCPCAVAHCNHAATTVPAIDTAPAPVGIAAIVLVKSSNLISAFLQTPERPPRA